MNTDDPIHKAALELAQASMGKLAERRMWKWDGPEIHALARLRESLGLCRECGGDKKGVGKNWATGCKCAVLPSLEDDTALPPDPDYHRDAKRNGDF